MKNILVTGATGRIGRVVVPDLVDRGYLVRAVSSRPLQQPSTDELVEWRRFDFLTESNYLELVQGCDAIIHLAAEIGKADRMQVMNIEATKSLAQAAEMAGVRAFCYISSVAVYGSGKTRLMTEESPVLTIDRDIRSEYQAHDYVRCYGRTKLGGEFAIRQIAHRVRYVILRPTVVVDTPDLIGIRNWSYAERALKAHRHAHHIYVRDVSNAIIWSICHVMGSGEDGCIGLYNLSEDEFGEPRYGDFMRKAYKVSNDRRYNVPIVPGVADSLHDLLRYRTFLVRNPLWRMRFPCDRLFSRGYRHRYGLSQLQATALAKLRGEK